MASIFIFLTGTFQMYSQVYNLDLFPGSYPATHYQYCARFFIPRVIKSSNWFSDPGRDVEYNWVEFSFTDWLKKPSLRSKKQYIKKKK